MSSRKIGLNLVVIVALAALFTGIWALYNRPVSVPDWPERISGFSFSPFRLNQNPQSGRYPSAEQMRADLELVARHTHSIRTYSVQGALGDIPALAEAFGLRVSLGIWLGPDLAGNEAEIARAIRIANESPSVVRVIVGNEALFRREVTAEQLIAYLDRVRAAVKVPVTTAEQWHVYREHPELAQHVDLIAAHVLPYWEATPVADAVDFVLERARTQGRLPEEAAAARRGRLAEQRAHARQRRGDTRGPGHLPAAPDQRAQRRRLQLLRHRSLRPALEGQRRRLGGRLLGRLQRRPQGQVQLHRAGGADSQVARPGHRLGGTRGTRLHPAADRQFLAAPAREDLPRRGLVRLRLGAGVDRLRLQPAVQHLVQPDRRRVAGRRRAGVVIVLFTEAHELAEAVWTRKRRRPFLPITAAQAYRPKVSIHVPCYNEPPELLKQTLDALARLDYPDYEVLVIDNNTRDPTVWQPVEAHCARLGERFRFFHVAPLEGFKAGALNFALGHVAADVEVVAVIDADYCVDPDWLRHMVPHFGDPRIAVVQSPQDYRDQHESAFKRLCYAEYKGFFHIGMVTRNDRDAIIEHGTMTMIRRSVLDELRWPEWCITEDAELGLRVFEKGLSAAYFERSYGKGVMPDTFIDFKKQRFRWAYGAIQIMKRHTDALLRGRGPDGSRLTRGQRYHFVAGWLPWIADGLNIFFTLGALLWSAAMIIVPKRVDPPLLIFAILPLALFAFKVGKILFLYRRTVGVDLRDSFFAALAGLSLSHTIAKAVLYGFVTRGIPFFRTPKMRSSHGLLVALAEAREEVFVMLLLWGAAAGIVAVQGVPSRDLLIWVAMLLVQSLPYLAALVMALLSSLPKPREELAGGAEQIGG